MFRLLILLVCIVFTQVGCCGYRAHALPAGAVQLTNVSNAYAFTMADFEAFAPQYADAGEDYHLIQGLYLPSSDRIYLKCQDPRHLTFPNYLILLHELAHREDHVLGHNGSSVLWRILWNSPNGRYWCTHPEIVVQILQDEVQDPRTGYYSELQSRLLPGEPDAQPPVALPKYIPIQTPEEEPAQPIPGHTSDPSVLPLPGDPKAPTEPAETPNG